MAALAAVHNPVDPKETLLFFCAQDQQVGLSPRKEDADEPGSPPKFHNPAAGAPVEDTPTSGIPMLVDNPKNVETPKGVIKNPSCFGAIFYKSLVCVYGIRTDDVICLVSPAFQPLKSNPTTKHSLAACGDGKKIGWLYYLTQDPPVISEYRLDPGASTIIQAQPKPDTYLCAFYANPKRYVIYQVATGLAIVDVASGQGGEIKNTGSAKPKTPMCVVNNKGIIYLYYCDKENNLMRIVQKNGIWKNNDLVDGAPVAANGTQMAVTATTDGSFNMLFYIAQGGDGKYIRYMDPIDS